MIKKHREMKDKIPAKLNENKLKEREEEKRERNI